MRGSAMEALYSTDDDRLTARSAASNRASVAFSSEPLGSTSFNTGNEGRRRAARAETGSQEAAGHCGLTAAAGAGGAEGATGTGWAAATSTPGRPSSVTKLA